MAKSRIRLEPCGAAGSKDLLDVISNVTMQTLTVTNMIEKWCVLCGVCCVQLYVVLNVERNGICVTVSLLDCVCVWSQLSSH